MTNAPIFFQQRIEDFDASVLPVGARTPGTAEFRMAVTLVLAAKYVVAGQPAMVLVDDEEIVVLGVPQGEDAVEYGIDMLKDGRISEGISYLERLSRHLKSDSRLYYNLGVAYNQLNQYDEAVIRLKRSLSLSSHSSRSYSALAFAYNGLGRADLALQAARAAVKEAPDDEYSHINLAAALAQQRDFSGAEEHFRKALEIAPGYLPGKLALANVLAESGDEARRVEAEKLVQELLSRADVAQSITDSARTLSNELAQQRIKRSVPGGFRMDVVMYIVGALERFDALGRVKAGAVLLEIAKVTSRGVSVAVGTTYAVPGLEGEFSGMQLLSTLYAGLRWMGNDVDMGLDFSAEYEEALKFHGLKRP
jgi:tetratricopeptide (TPR) repeat protein